VLILHGNAVDLDTQIKIQQHHIKILKEEFDRIVKEKDQLNRTKLELERKLRENEDDYKYRLRDHSNQLQAKYDKEIQERYERGKREENETWQNYVTALEENHKARIQSLESELDRVKADNMSFQSANERLKNEHRRQLEHLHTDYSLRLSKAETERDTEKKEREAEMARRERIYKSAIDKMSANHNTEIKQMQQERKSMEEQLTLTNTKLKQDHAISLEKQEREHAKKISKMRAEHAAALERLMADVAAYSGALLTRDQDDFKLWERDNFKPMSDNDIEDRFSKLVGEVDTLSRLEWKANPKAWTSQILHRLSTNQRVLKKQILQDSMWVMLHDFIFCSPFRIFGEEGRILESQWNKQCGKGQLPTLFNPPSFAGVDFSRCYSR